ncbi:hypothetical protein BGZ54_005327 [Gamsiella multidivaricata]|nr:hypothetical protein BGZ54_005327 [Gamsiella multidivaricata]
MSILDGQREYGSSFPVPTDISSIVPGTIFQDDVPPPTFIDGSYDPPTPQQQYPPSSSLFRATPTGSSTGNGDKHVQIEVNSTTQTVLISLGVCVGVLFLLGVLATHYISHKNKRAEKKKKRALEGDGAGAEAEGEREGAKWEKARGFGTESGGIGLESQRGSEVRISDLETVLIDEKDGGVGTRLEKGKNPRKTSVPTLANCTQSPKQSNIIGAVGMAVGGGGHAGTGSFQMGASGPRGEGGVNPRNSFMDATQVFTRRPSITRTPSAPIAPLRAATPRYSHEHPHQGVNLQIGIYPNDAALLGSGFSQELTSPMFPISPSSLGTEHMDFNPFASPPPSAGSKSSLFLDPFRTHNNSQLSLNLIMTNDDSAVLAEDDGPYPFPTASASDSDTKPNSFSPDGLSSSSPTGAPPLPPRSLDDLSEPKLVLRHFQSSISADHRYTLMRTSSNTSSDSPPHGVFGPSFLSSPATRPGVERQAGFSPGVADRRSIAGSVVTPTPTAECYSPGGSINEGNAWYRRRASVIIPESGSAHVRLWKDGESSPRIANRSSRSESQSSSHSDHSHESSIGPSPLGQSRAQKDTDAVSQDPPQQQQQELITQEQDKLKSGRDEEENGLLRKTTRNGAAVFEGTQSNKGSGISRSPSPAPVVVEPGQESSSDVADRTKSEQEEVDQVVVRLRTPRRESHTGSTHGNRRSYLDDYREPRQH